MFRGTRLIRRSFHISAIRLGYLQHVAFGYGIALPKQALNALDTRIQHRTVRGPERFDRASKPIVFNSNAWCESGNVLFFAPVCVQETSVGFNENIYGPNLTIDQVVFEWQLISNHPDATTAKLLHKNILRFLAKHGMNPDKPAKELYDITKTSNAFHDWLIEKDMNKPLKEMIGWYVAGMY